MPVPNQGPLGQYGIARSLVQTPGWKPLEAEQNEMLPGGGGGGFGMRFGGGPQQRPYNDMERTILAHNYPGGFKVATDQYAAKNSEQLNAWAKEEMKQKYPQGPASGLTWDQEFDRQAAEREKYQTTKKLTGKEELWGPLNPVKKLTVNRPSRPINYTPAVENAYRDRSGLVTPVVKRTSQAAAQRAANIARNKSAIASRPRASFSRTGGRTSTSAAAYSRFGRGR